MCGLTITKNGMVFMSKEAKLLFISLLLLVLGVAYMYVSQHYTCFTFEYQNLSGTHSKTVCEWNKPSTCWDMYSTEQQAIQHCERNQ